MASEMANFHVSLESHNFRRWAPPYKCGFLGSELSPESLNLNGNIFFELFPTDLDERLASAGYKKDQEKKQNKTAEQADNISSRGFRHENENTAYFWINSALEASNWSQITFCILVLISISERFCHNFEQINISLTVTAILLACILN